MSELWAEAFASSIGRVDEGLDSGRINQAFKDARHTLLKWPSPAQVIGLMPRRQEAERIVHAPGPTDKGRDAFDICQRVISGELSVTDANALMADGQYSEEIDQPF